MTAISIYLPIFQTRARSKKFNEARMEKMKMRDEVVIKCKQAALAQLIDVSVHPRYPELLTALLGQVCKFSNYKKQFFVE